MSYLLQEDGVSKFTLEDGTGSVLLEGTSGPAPTNTVAPAVTGTATVGSTLSTTNGTWTDDGSPTFTYQWQDSPDGTTGWANIPGATAQTYPISSGESAKYARSAVTDTDSNGSTTAYSAAVGPIATAPGGSGFNVAVNAGSFF